jgi:cytochrome c oxidase subunit 3
VNIIEQLRQKPWTAEQVRVDDRHDGRAYVLPTAKLGLRILLTAITVLLSLFVVAYSDRMVVSDWRPVPEPWVLWLNTLVLVGSSVAMQNGLVAARQGRMERFKMSLLAAGGSAFVFLLGQLWVWRQLVDLGFFAAGNPANAFFYLMTALHGLHLLGGLVAWTRLVARLTHGDTRRLRMGMELCTVYWHFLLVVWLIFFALLLYS